MHPPKLHTKTQSKRARKSRMARGRLILCMKFRCSVGSPPPIGFIRRATLTNFSKTR
jgi:hypothetical protein